MENILPVIVMSIPIALFIHLYIKVEKDIEEIDRKRQNNQKEKKLWNN